MSYSTAPACLYDVYLSDPYSEHNPDGVIDLSTAENHLLVDFILPEMKHCADLNDPAVLSYGQTGGSFSLRNAFKGFMERVTKAEIDERQLTIVSGAEVAIQILLQAICKPGDVVATIVPCYAGFTKACARLGLSQMMFANAIDTDIEMPNLTKDIRVVLISNPDVPTGRCWSRAALNTLIEATKANDQHLIVDEVVSPAVLSECGFISAAAFADQRIHVVFGLSKIGMAGLRVGAIYSGLPRPHLIELSRTAVLSSFEQKLAVNMLRDQAFLENLLDISRARLCDAYAIAVDRLATERIDVRQGSAGLTILVYLGADSSVESLMSEPKVYLKEMAEFGCDQPGWFRMALATDSKTVASAIQRLGRYLRRRSPLSLLIAYRSRFSRLWKRTEELWAVLKVNAKWPNARPIQLRHPFIFYVGHLPAFAINRIGLALGEENVKRINPDYDKLFARGIDPDVISGEVHPHSADINQLWWPSISQIEDYVEEVHEIILSSLPMLLSSGHINTVEIVLEHELMHQETLVYMIAQCEPSNLQNPPSFQKSSLPTPAIKQTSCHVPAGRAVLGCDGSVLSSDRFGWDNEFPKVTVDVNAFEVMSLPVSNGEYIKFIDNGGYSNKGFWTERHWRWLQTDSITHPASWKFEEIKRQWFVRVSLVEYMPLEQVQDYPVIVSYAEASAFCRYKGARIMTEAEYHRAAYGDDVNQPYPWGYLPPASVQANADFNSWTLRPSGIGNTASCFGVADLVGQAWEWTSTTFAPLNPQTKFEAMPAYEGYSSEFFDGNHVVMKGGSWATDKDILRPSFRNWYQDCYHYAFAKFRLVLDRNMQNGIPEDDIVYLMREVDVAEQESRFWLSIKAGLMSSPKTIHSMHFYDDRGSELYAKITELDEYYLTRTESEILEKYTDDIGNLIHAHLQRYDKRYVNVVECGAGDGRKTIPLLKRLHKKGLDLRYFPIDISKGALMSLKKKLQWNNCAFSSKFILGDNICGLEHLAAKANGEALTLVLFLGSSIGNYGRSEASLLLQSMCSKLRPGDIAIIGFDLVKSTNDLLPAYADKQGITAEFNRNLIRRLNTELNAHIPEDVFRHYATFNPIKRRMESFLIATKPLEITLSIKNTHHDDEIRIGFDAWEPIHVENSYKYTLKDIQTLGLQSGFQQFRNLLDDRRWFSDTIFYVN